MRFRLLTGQHIQDDPADLEAAAREKRAPRGRTYLEGEVIESAYDLNRLNPADPALRKKFERLPDNPSADWQAPSAGQFVNNSPPPQPPGSPPLAPPPASITAADYATLEAMTADELKKWSDAEGFSTGKAKGKDEMLKVLKGYVR